MERNLSLKQKAGIKYLVTVWEKVDKRPSKVEDWYPSRVQMESAVKKMIEEINSSKSLPKKLKKYLLEPLKDEELLIKHSHDFYYEFEKHPSEYLERFILQSIREARRAARSSGNNRSS